MSQIFFFLIGKKGSNEKIKYITNLQGEKEGKKNKKQRKTSPDHEESEKDAGYKSTRQEQA